MAAKPKRSSFPNGRGGAAKYAQALRTWKKGSTTTSTTKSGRTRAQNRRSSSAAATAKATSGTRKPALKPIPASKRPKDMQAGKVYGDAGQPKAPKLPPKPSPKSAPKPAPKAPTKKPAAKKPAAKKPAPKAATATNARSLRSGPTPPKPKRKTSTTKGPTKSGSHYKGQMKSSRLSSALAGVKAYKRKKK